MSDDDAERGAMPALAEQADWTQRHGEILKVEPLVSLAPADREEFLVGLGTVTREEDLDAEHLRLLRAAEVNLARRELPRDTPQT